MQEFNLREFIARSIDTEGELPLFEVLADLPTLYEYGPWLAGGALRRTLTNQKLETDFDFFFRDKVQLEKFAAELERKGLTKRRETQHHVHYSGKVAGATREVQLIRFKYYENAIDVINSFDFTICQFAFDGTTLTAGDHAFWDLGRKRLAINKITYPVSTMRRVLKYAKQGYYACNGALAAILRETARSTELQQQLNISYID
jgi:hypothetical protein